MPRLLSKAPVERDFTFVFFPMTFLRLSLIWESTTSPPAFSTLGAALSNLSPSLESLSINSSGSFISHRAILNHPLRIDLLGEDFPIQSFVPDILDRENVVPAVFCHNHTAGIELDARYGTDAKERGRPGKKAAVLPRFAPIAVFTVGSDACQKLVPFSRKAIAVRTDIHTKKLNKVLQLDAHKITSRSPCRRSFTVSQTCRAASGESAKKPAVEPSLLS